MPASPCSFLSHEVILAATFILTEVAIRSDRYGQYYTVGEDKVGVRQHERELDEDTLVKHFTATNTSDVVCIVTASAGDGETNLVVIDLDAHDEDSRGERMPMLLEQARAIEGILESQCGAPCLIDASDRGVKVWVRTDSPVSVREAHDAGRQLVRMAGCDPDTEVLPKIQSPGTHPGLVRVPGLHPLDKSWSRFFQHGAEIPPEKWLAHLTQWNACSADVVRDLAAAYQPSSVQCGGTAKPQAHHHGLDVAMVVERLKERGCTVRQIGTTNSYQAQCPAHDDHNPSLSVRASKKGGVAIKCFARCTREEVLEALDLVPRGNTPSTVPESMAGKIVELIDDVELFHAPDGMGYVTLLLEGHLETWPIESRTFRDYVSKVIYDRTRRVPSANAVKDALGVLQGRARFDGPEREVFVRVGHDGSGGVVYIDLGDPSWDVVRIDAAGWDIVSDCPVRFRRPAGMLPLPRPVRGGSIEDLRPFLNLEDEDQWHLVAGWLVGALHPDGPYPVLILVGEQGCAKTTTQRVLRALIDPHEADVGFEPSSIDDLIIAADNAWVLSFDNFSHLNQRMSDALCRMSTGGAMSTRKLYTNREIEHFKVQRPVVINSIGEIATQHDLLDRAILLDLPPLLGPRRTEDELWSEFAIIHDKVLGALYDAISRALRNYREFSIIKRPRLADFAQWACAAGPLTEGPDFSFLRAYEENRIESRDIALESSPVIAVLQGFMNSVGRWEGTMGALLQVLSDLTQLATQERAAWPRSPKGLRDRLNRSRSDLRAIGIEWETFKSNGKRGIRLWSTNATKNQSSSSSSVSSHTSLLPHTIPQRPVPWTSNPVPGTGDADTGVDPAAALGILT